MSRIGKKPVQVPDGVKVQVDDRIVSSRRPHGQAPVGASSRGRRRLRRGRPSRIVVTRSDDERLSRALHGLTRALLQNMVVGVTQGYEKTLGDLRRRLPRRGPGKDACSFASVWPTSCRCRFPTGLKVTCPDQQHIVIKGIDKQMVGQFAAEVRAMRKPEPYKGKGIRYLGEAVRRKQGKAMVK